MYGYARAMPRDGFTKAESNGSAAADVGYQVSVARVAGAAR
jgi:hypothetical protein